MNKCFCDICGAEITGEKAPTCAVTKADGEKVEVEIASTLIIVGDGDTASESWVDACTGCKLRAFLTATSQE